MLKETKIFVAVLIGISSLLFVINLNATHNVVGKAFYINGEELGMTETQYPYREEVASVNTAFWGIILILLVIFIITMHVIEHKDKKK